MPTLDKVALLFLLKTPATSGQTTKRIASIEVNLDVTSRKWSAERVLPTGSYIVRAELEKNDDGGGEFGRTEAISFDVQVVTINPGGVKKSPFPKVPTVPK